jgi:hypothetical protein
MSISHLFIRHVEQNLINKKAPPVGGAFLFLKIFFGVSTIKDNKGRY